MVSHRGWGWAGASGWPCEVQEGLRGAAALHLCCPGTTSESKQSSVGALQSQGQQNLLQTAAGLLRVPAEPLGQPGQCQTPPSPARGAPVLGAAEQLPRAWAVGLCCSRLSAQSALSPHPVLALPFVEQGVGKVWELAGAPGCFPSLARVFAGQSSSAPLQPQPRGAPALPSPAQLCQPAQGSLVPLAGAPAAPSAQLRLEILLCSPCAGTELL